MFQDTQATANEPFVRFFWLTTDILSVLLLHLVAVIFLLAQAQLISDNGNQEKNWIPLMETYFLGNLTLSTNSAIS